MMRFLFLLSAISIAACDAEDAALSHDADSVRLGSLETSQIDAVVVEHMPQIEACYDAAQASDPGLAGRLVARLVISVSGDVSQAELVEDDLGVDVLSACVLDAVTGMVFPEPSGDGIVIVRYPFLFAPGA
jgi:hypothetical protein